MPSAELGRRIARCKESETTSQVSLLLRHHELCVTHVAKEVDDLLATVKELKNRELSFDTTVIGFEITIQRAFDSRDRILLLHSNSSRVTKRKILFNRM